MKEKLTEEQIERYERDIKYYKQITGKDYGRKTVPLEITLQWILEEDKQNVLVLRKYDTSQLKKLEKNMKDILERYK